MSQRQFGKFGFWIDDEMPAIRERRRRSRDAEQSGGCLPELRYVPVRPGSYWLHEGDQKTLVKVRLEGRALVVRRYETGMGSGLPARPVWEIEETWSIPSAAELAKRGVT